jgi:hypothetical protein
MYISLGFFSITKMATRNTCPIVSTKKIKNSFTK